MTTRTPTMAEIIRLALEDRLADVHTVLPGKITAYDNATQKAEVLPMVRRRQETVDGEIDEALPVIPDVPVVFPRAGGFKITFPVAVGDRCILAFCERSVDNYQIGQSDDPVDPELYQKHHLTDPVALLGWYQDKDALTGVATTGLDVGADDNKATVRVEGDKITVWSDRAGDRARLELDGDEIRLFENLAALASMKVGGGEINLGDQSAADFVALAGKVLTELNKLASDVNSLKTVFSAWIPVPNDGGAALKTAATTWFGSPVTISPVAATKVKAT